MFGVTVLGVVHLATAGAEERRRPSDPIERVKVPRLSAHDQARRATEDAKSDPTLRAGDIISTGRGLLQFEGRADAERQEKDFVPIRRGK